MSMVVADEFAEIELFNDYAREHTDELASIMSRAKGTDDLVNEANRLGFAISSEQVGAYVRRELGNVRRKLIPGVLATFTSTTSQLTTNISAMSCVKTGISCTANVGATSGHGPTTAQTNVNVVVIGLAVASVTVF